LQVVGPQVHGGGRTRPQGSAQIGLRDIVLEYDLSNGARIPTGERR